MPQHCTRHSAEFMARVALETLPESKTLAPNGISLFQNNRTAMDTCHLVSSLQRESIESPLCDNVTDRRPE